MSPAQATPMNQVQPPATLTAGGTARRMAHQGRDIIDLSQSSPHHTTPQHITDAGVSALQDGLTNISSSRGLPEFRQAMANKLLSHNDLQVDPQTDVLVTPGSKMGLYDSINAYVDRGDEVMIVEPNWVSFRQQVELSEGMPAAVALSKEEEYALTYDVLAAEALALGGGHVDRVRGPEPVDAHLALQRPEPSGRDSGEKDRRLALWSTWPG